MLLVVCFYTFNFVFNEINFFENRNNGECQSDEKRFVFRFSADAIVGAVSMLNLLHTPQQAAGHTSIPAYTNQSNLTYHTIHTINSGGENTYI